METKTNKLDLLLALAPFAVFGNDDDDKGEDNSEETSEEGEGNEEAPEFASFDDYLSKQDPGIRKLYEAHVSGLKNTVKTTRKERDGLANQLKKLSDSLEKQPEIQKQINDMTSQLTSANQRADFFAEAPSEGCKNPKAAFALAKSEDLFTRNGDPDWDAIRETAPELFVDPDSLKTEGGKGTGDKKKKKTQVTMNDLIRSATRGARTTQ